MRAYFLEPIDSKSPRLSNDTQKMICQERDDALLGFGSERLDEKTTRRGITPFVKSRFKQIVITVVRYRTIAGVHVFQYLLFYGVLRSIRKRDIFRAAMATRKTKTHSLRHDSESQARCRT